MIEENRIYEREKRIRYTAITSVLAKLLAMLVPLITVRYAYDYLGAEIYGLWNTVLSFFSMFAFADLGLGSGLQTSLSQAQGRDDMEESRKLISSTWLILVISTTVMLLAMLSIYPFVDWGSVMNVSSKDAELLVGKVVLIIVVSKLLIIPFSIVNRTQLALQEGYRGNIWQCMANILSMVLIVWVVLADIGKIPLIIASTYAVVIVSILNFIVYFGFQRKGYAPKRKYIEGKTAKHMLQIGIAFGVLSIFTNLGISLDSFIVAQVSNLSESATYSILYRATGLISVGCGMLSAPLWGAFGEALVRKDYAWVKIRSRKTALLSLAIALAGTAGLLLFGRIIFSIWLGKTLQYSILMLIGMCLMQCLLSFVSPYFMILNARGIVKKQILIFGIYTLIAVPMKYLGGKWWGIDWIPLIGVACYGMILVPYVYYLARKEMR